LFFVLTRPHVLTRVSFCMEPPRSPVLGAIPRGSRIPRQNVGGAFFVVRLAFPLLIVLLPAFSLNNYIFRNIATRQGSCPWTFSPIWSPRFPLLLSDSPIFVSFLHPLPAFGGGKSSSGSPYHPVLPALPLFLHSCLAAPSLSDHLGSDYGVPDEFSLFLQRRFP